VLFAGIVYAGVTLRCVNNFFCIAAALFRSNIIKAGQILQKNDKGDIAFIVF